jgi:hypothetical protein
MDCIVSARSQLRIEWNFLDELRLTSRRIH